MSEHQADIFKKYLMDWDDQIAKSIGFDREGSLFSEDPLKEKLLQPVSIRSTDHQKNMSFTIRGDRDFEGSEIRDGTEQLFKSN